MNHADKKMQAGKALFMQGIANIEIARTLGVSENTVSSWVKKGNWREERANGHAIKKTIQDSILTLIDYQLEALLQATEVNRSNNPDKLKLLDKAEIDALSKMFATIKGKEQTWANVVTTIREYTAYVNEKDNDLAKAMIPFADDFLMTKRDIMTA